MSTTDAVSSACATAAHSPALVQMQTALEGNRAHQRQVESLQYGLDEHGRTLSDDVRKKMASLREVR